jgi:uncharacterized protein
MVRSATRLLTLFVVLAAFFWPTTARAAFEPPPLRGHVVDTAKMLSPAEVGRLNAKLDQARRQTGFAVVVYTLPQVPEGMTIEDVGYEAGNAWGAGSKEGDDGVLLIATVHDRHLRIETGKGVGGALTDVESHHINRDVIGPLMRDGRHYEALDRGTSAILKALMEGTPGGVSEPGRGPAREVDELPPPDPLKTAIMGLVLLGVIILAIVSPTFRHILFFMLLFGRRGGGGGFGGGGGGGYGGGGGGFGGGGSSDNY